MEKQGLLAGACQTEAYSIILPTILFSLSQIVIHSILPQVIIELVCYQDSGLLDCDSAEISGKASLVNLISSCVINIPCIFLIGFYASFANKYGLQPTLLSPVLGNFLFLACILIARKSQSYYAWIMVGSLLSGLSGGRNSFMMATFAYAADVSSPQERSKVFSVIESSIYCAKILCPFTIGILSKQYGFGLSLGIGLFLCLFNALWITFAMKDPIQINEDNVVQMAHYKTVNNLLISYNKEENNDLDRFNSDDITIDKTQRKLSFHPFATFHSVSKLWGKNSIGNATVPFLSGVYFMYHMIAVGVHVVEILFVKHKLRWDAFTIGLYGSMHGVMEISSMLLAPIIASQLLGFNMTDLFWIETGLWARSLFFCLFGFSYCSIELFLILLVLLLSGPVVPRIRSYLSNSVCSEQQNDLFAALAALDAISSFISPIFTAIYFNSVTYFPGFVFEIISLLFIFSALVILFVRRGFGKEILDYLPVSEPV